MTAAAAVLVCAIEMLGRSQATMPQIELVSTRPVDVSANADAFVRDHERIIYIVTASDAFANARCGSQRSMLKLASILAHEEWHIKNGPDERRAYEYQLATLMRLGAAPDSAVYRSVARAMQQVLRAKKPKPPARPEGLLARQD